VGVFYLGENDVNRNKREALYQDAQAIKDEHEAVKRRTATGIVNIGEILYRCRDRLAHNKAGGFEGWCQTEFGWGKSTAYRFIQVYESFGNRPNLGQLDIRQSALYLLASPSTPEPVRQEMIDRAEAGETVTHNDIKEAKDRNKKKTGSKTSSGPTYDSSSQYNQDVDNTTFFYQYGQETFVFDCTYQERRQIERAFDGNRRPVEVLLAAANLDSRSLNECLGLEETQQEESIW